MDHRFHRLVARFLLLGLLLVQFSGAALACPLPTVDRGAPAMHEGCSGHQALPAPAPANSALCELHCQTALTVPATPMPPVAIVGGEPLLIPVFHAAAPAEDDGAARSAPLAMATAPPVSIRFCRFQI